jgi:hypothetical protein
MLVDLVVEQECEFLPLYQLVQYSAFFRQRRVVVLDRNCLVYLILADLMSCHMIVVVSSITITIMETRVWFMSVLVLDVLLWPKVLSSWIVVAVHP